MFFTWSLENKLSAIWCCIFRGVSTIGLMQMVFILINLYCILSPSPFWPPSVFQNEVSGPPASDPPTQTVKTADSWAHHRPYETESLGRSLEIYMCNKHCRRPVGLLQLQNHWILGRGEMKIKETHWIILKIKNSLRSYFYKPGTYTLIFIWQAGEITGCNQVCIGGVTEVSWRKWHLSLNPKDACKSGRMGSRWMSGCGEARGEENVPGTGNRLHKGLEVIKVLHE